MDNCRSFLPLASYLIDHWPADRRGSLDIVAIDFPGHGKSSHTSVQNPHMFGMFCMYHLAEVVNKLGWWVDETDRGKLQKRIGQNEESGSSNARRQNQQKFMIIGHSMGATVTSLYASVFPEQVQCAVLLDAYALFYFPDKGLVSFTRDHVNKRMQYNASDPNQKRRTYSSLNEAIEARMKTTRDALGGHQYISREAAQDIVQRGVKQVANGYQFVHDVRLGWKPFMRLTKAQRDEILRKVQCPCALLMAKDGWPFFHPVHGLDEEEEILRLFRPALYRNDLPGSHHFHADPDTRTQVANVVLSFLLQHSTDAEPTTAQQSRL